MSKLRCQLAVQINHKKPLDLNVGCQFLILEI